MPLPDDERWLRRAFQLAREARAAGDDPFGAVLVDAAGALAAQSRDRSVTLADPTAHAELHLIRTYCQRTRRFDLTGYTLYCSTEPCLMCSGAIHWARISRVVFGLSQAMLQEKSGGQPKLGCASVATMGSHTIDVSGPLLVPEARAVLADYTWIPKRVRVQAPAAPAETRPAPLDVARRFVAQRFPACEAAFLAGSVVRGEATATSDLDIVIVGGQPEAPYRQSLLAEGWPVEVFVHTRESIRQFFASDAERRRPSLPVMCLEGTILRNQDGAADAIKAEAQALITTGPPALTPEAITGYRYAITDLLDDLTGSTNFAETALIAPDLAGKASELLLGLNRQWYGQGKWILRALHRFDPAQADQLSEALRALYRDQDATLLVAWVEAILAPVGGRLFDGYRLSGK